MEAITCRNCGFTMVSWEWIDDTPDGTPRYAITFHQGALGGEITVKILDAENSLGLLACQNCGMENRVDPRRLGLGS